MRFDRIYNWYDKRQAWEIMSAVFAAVSRFKLRLRQCAASNSAFGIVGAIRRIMKRRGWTHCKSHSNAVCGNQRMYAVIRQERKSTVENEIFLLLLKCHKWLCCAVCRNRRMYAVTRQERECTVADKIFLLLPKCHKWLCYAVCGNRRMYAVIR